MNRGLSKYIIVIIMLLLFTLPGIAAADKFTNCFFTSGIPYVYGGNCTHQLDNNYNLSIDYGKGIQQKDYKAGIELGKKFKHGTIIQSIGLEFGSEDVLTHSLTLPYDWVGITLKEKIQKNFSCCGNRLGWYLYGSVSLENRKYHERSGIFVEEKNEIGLGLGVGLSLKVL